ncbi:hypothetical protein PC39_01345 [Salinisphaera sp. PC39]|uniref:twin transmembrane helix small protein n=1 Tax=Salinisphaera sp. PC39 TaxID=1304156 RepID=UPI003340D6C7
MTTSVIVAFLFGIVAALLAGMVFLVKDNGSRRRTVGALTLRIGLSLALIAFLVAGYLFGWIQPHGVTP